MHLQPPRRALLAALALSACVTAAPPPASLRDPVVETAERAVAAADRTPEDRALDAGRHPAELLIFLGLRPGARVAELGAGGGYTAELLARAVGPTGVVYAQNSKIMRSFVGDRWDSRLQRPAMARVLRVDRELEEPLPPEARALDLVLMQATYHDTLWLDVDRARMNRAVFEALAPGGAFVIIDSSAKEGSGRDEAYNLHRVDEQLVRREVEAAGFKLIGSSSFLRNPDDARDWNSAPNEAGARRGTSDRFALRFVKP